MFKSLKRIVYYSDDIEKAKEWYNIILESQPLFDSPFVIIYVVGNCSLSIAKKERCTTRTDESLEVYWEVDDIETALAKLTGHGAIIYAPLKEIMNIRIAKVIDPFGNVIGLTGEMAKQSERSVEKQASGTAMTVAFCRALASKENREELKGPDYLAEMFLSVEEKRLLKDEDSRKWVIQNMVTSPLYGYFIARTAYVDSVFLKACQENIPQIVFLGAGYDTRSYRFSDKIKNTSIFELDISTTQKKKVEILKENNIVCPHSLSFVEINFKSEMIIDVLHNAGYDPAKKTLFIWEGVIYYLAKDDVENTLQFLKQNSANGSTVCFDYMTQKLESVNAAEPFQFWGQRKDIEKMLSEYGLGITEHLDYSEMQMRYLTLKDGTLAEKCLPFFSLVTAIKS